MKERAMTKEHLSLEDLRFDDRGLLPVVAQDAATGQVLMAAWANREALERTLATGELHFYSRSRQALWRKGETSGNTLALRELIADCDGDTLLARVIPSGPTCHTGERSCFHRPLSGEASEGGGFLDRLERIVASRRGADPALSYTARLFGQGRLRIAQKVGEEGVEVALATAAGNGAPGGGVGGPALPPAGGLAEREVPLAEVLACLERRHRERTVGGPSSDRP
jgi:phosphoribosyl-ATP pyrophosphohydrolase/phosphoribosyl-AMP cyclohydrolase